MFIICKELKPYIDLCENSKTHREEEETTEYDVPSNNKLIKTNYEEEQLYENQHYANPRQSDLEPIYMNELSDDRSSGYRSSSSPSIHSEENLYANESVAASHEELNLRGSRVSCVSIIVGYKLGDKHEHLLWSVQGWPLIMTAAPIISVNLVNRRPQLFLL